MNKMKSYKLVVLPLLAFLVADSVSGPPVCPPALNLCTTGKASVIIPKTWVCCKDVNAICYYYYKTKFLCNCDVGAPTSGYKIYVASDPSKTCDINTGCY